MAIDEQRTLWELTHGKRRIRCVMRSCCSGAELQVWAEPIAGDHRPTGLDELIGRELYPSKSDLFERARALQRAYRESPECADHIR